MNDPQRVESFRKEVSEFLAMQQRRHTMNFRLHWLLVVLVLIGSSLTTIGSILRWQYEIIALIGVVSSVLIAIHTAIAIGDKAEFQRIIASDAANILTYLSDSGLVEDNFVRLREQFTELRKHADSQLPRGGGMEAVRNLPKPPS